jgi:UDP-N-acetylmuramyl tripeptide synthase
MRLLDCRRLPGPNLIVDKPGAVIDVEFGEHPPNLVIGAWESQARRLLDELGWKDEVVCGRRFEGGASLAITAPVDALYAATEIVEAAWDAARDQVEGGNRQLLRRVARSLREEVRDEERPRLQRLLAAAREHRVPVVLDTEEVSLGLGVHSRCWTLGDVPHPDDVDWASLKPIPLALVTGTNGKTTTVRLMSAIGAAAGLTTGISSTDWLSIGGEIIEKDDYAGPEGARKILRHRRCELAVLETARGGLLRRGLAVQRADAALITNIASDHLGEFGVQTLAELADVKWVVTRALDEEGVAVLNADDPLLVERGLRHPGRIIWFSHDPGNPLLKAHREAGGTVCTLNRGRIVLMQGDAVTPVVSLKKIPICFGGAARHNVANALGATGLSTALSIEPAAIASGLCALRNEDNPGRGNLYQVGEVSVLLDFAHNPHGLRAMVELAAALPARRRALIIGQAGDRSDDDIRELAWAAEAIRFERVYIKKPERYSRGRPVGEAAAMLREEFLAQGYKARNLASSKTESSALRSALKWAEPGDLVVCLAHEDRDKVMAELDALQAESRKPAKKKQKPARSAVKKA